MKQELGVPGKSFPFVQSITAYEVDNEVGNLSTAFNVGLTTGAFTWGILVDVVGRKWCFNLTCLVASIFGFAFASESDH